LAHEKRVRPNQDIDIFYEMEGSGEPLLLLHGGTGCHENWIHAGGETFAHEYTVIKMLVAMAERTIFRARLHIGNVRWTPSLSLTISELAGAARLD